MHFFDEVSLKFGLFGCRMAWTSLWPSCCCCLGLRPTAATRTGSPLSTGLRQEVLLPSFSLPRMLPYPHQPSGRKVYSYQHNLS